MALVGLTLAGAAASTEHAQADDWLPVNLNTPTMVQQGTTYVPLRATVESLGARMAWKADGQNKMRLDIDGKSYELVIASGSAGTTLFNPATGAATPAPVSGGVTFVTLDFFQSLSGRDVILSSANQLVLIDKTGNSPIWNKRLNTYQGPAQPVAAPVTVQAQVRSIAPKEDKKAYAAPKKAQSYGNATDLIRSAEACLGVPYVWGGTSMQGFDCSGLTSYVFAQKGIQLPRVASDQQNFATPVPMEQAQPGDLVFWGSPAYHVGIYIGDGQYIHAASDGQVTVSQYNWYPYTSVGRV